MKKITLILILLTFSLGYSQDLLLGFEAGESGGVNGGPFGDGPAPVVEAGTGSNTSQVLRIVGNPAGQPWQGINLTLTSNVNLIATQQMTMDVLSATPITFLVKVTGGSGPAAAAAVTHPGGNTWETLSFTFNTVLDDQAEAANGVYSGFVIHTYWAPGATTFFNPTIPTPERTFYVDNIRGPLGAPPVDPAPTTAAPTPPNRPAADVRSLFSDVYDPVTVMSYSGDNNSYDTSWCAATTTLVQIEGNNTNKITGLGCEGIDFQAGRFDATGFTRFHIDIWTATPTQDRVFSFKFSNHNNTTQETNAWEYTATNANILPSGSEGEWIPIEIPFTSFNCINTPPGNACPSITDFVEFVITSDLGTVYYDNLYLHKNTVMSVSSFEKSNIKMFPNPATTNFTIDAEDMLENVVLYNMLGQAVINVTPNNQQANIDISGLQVGVYVVKATVNGVESTTRLVKK